MGEFWKYFKDVLNFPLIHKPNSLSVPIKGLALTLDTVKSDMLYLRDQFFPSKCDDALVSSFGKSRSITRYYKESSEEYRRRVVNAYNWHLLGGKTLGLPQILKFYGFDTIRIDNVRDFVPSRWAEFQVGLKTPTNHEEQAEIIEELEYLVWLINEYKPARSILARVYTDTYNFVPTVWSEAPDWSEGFWSHFSGVAVPDIDKDLIVSFGMVNRFQAEIYTIDKGAGYGIEEMHGVLCPYTDRPMWSRSDWSEIYVNNAGFTIGELVSLHWCKRIVVGQKWERGRKWDKKKWYVTATWDRILPRWQAFPYGQAKSQAVFSENRSENRNNYGLYGDINSNYSIPYVDIIEKEPCWSEFVYSEDKKRIKRILVLEQFYSVHTVQASSLHENSTIALQIKILSESSEYISYRDKNIWSECVWGENPVLRQAFQRNETHRSHFAKPVYKRGAWEKGKKWEKNPWAKTESYDRPLPVWTMFIHSISRDELYYSGGNQYGDINALYSPPANMPNERYEKINVSISKKLKDSNNINIFLHGKAHLAIHSQKRVRDFLFVGWNRHISGVIERCYSLRSWRGKWDKRKWREFIQYGRKLPKWQMQITSNTEGDRYE